MSSRLKSGQIAVFDDAMAVQAQLDFAQWGTSTNFVPANAIDATPVLYHTHTTPVLAAGTYSLLPVIQLTGSNAGTGIASYIAIDGFQFAPILTSASVPGGGFQFSGPLAQDWTAGDATHTFELWFYRATSPGAVTAVFSSFQWERKA